MTAADIAQDIEQLKQRRTWVAWKLEPGPNGKPTKVPYNPKTGDKAATTRPQTWLTFAEAEHHSRGYDGLGIILTDGLCGVDVDHCVNADGEIDHRGRQVIDLLDTYCEVSPSGTGLHLLLWAKLPPGGRKNTEKGIEVYGPGSPRFLTFTGNIVADAPATVEHRHEQFNALHQYLFPSDYVEKPKPSAQPPSDVTATDVELLQAAFGAANGHDNKRLFDEPGAPGNSEGDASLCAKLAFYSGGDAARLERLVRRSNRVREKWDSKRGAETWIGSECRKAIERHTGKWYTPKRKPPAQSAERTEPTMPEPATQPEAPAEASKPERADEPILWANAAVLAERTGAVQWLWEPWIPRGHITFLAGEPGVGKSAVALYFAACVSNGAPWPDGSQPTGDRAPVLIADSEGAQAIWINRIRDWGIDQSLLFFPGADGMGRVMLDDEKTLAGVRAQIEGEGVQLVIVDSLRTSLPAKVDENSSAVGSVLAAWADLCRDTGIALVIVHHFGKPRKDESREASLDRLRGSSAIGAMGRSVIAVDKPDTESDFVRLSCIKNNLALLPEALGLQIGAAGIDWTDEAPRAPRRETREGRAAEFIMAKLQRGPMLSPDLIKEGAEIGISKNSIYRAKDDLSLVIVPDATDPTGRRKLWALPARQAHLQHLS